MLILIIYNINIDAYTSVEIWYIFSPAKRDSLGVLIKILGFQLVRTCCMKTEQSC